MLPQIYREQFESADTPINLSTGCSAHSMVMSGIARMNNLTYWIDDNYPDSRTQYDESEQPRRSCPDNFPVKSYSPIIFAVVVLPKEAPIANANYFLFLRMKFTNAENWMSPKIRLMELDKVYPVGYIMSGDGNT